MPGFTAGASTIQPAAADRHERAARLVGQLDHHLVEGERVADAVADRLEQGGHVARLGQPRRDLEHVLEHPLVLGRRGHVLGDPDGKGRVPRARHERVDARRRSGRRPVSGSSTDTTPRSFPPAPRSGTKSASSACQASGSSRGLDLGHVGAAGDLVPVEARPAGRSRRRAARSAGASSGIQVSRSEVWPSSSCDRVVGAHGGRREHVVERRPVDVHDHGAVAERLADRVRHLPQHVLEVLVGAHRGGALEHGAEPADHRQRSRVQHGNPPMREADDWQARRTRHSCCYRRCRRGVL